MNGIVGTIMYAGPAHLAQLVAGQCYRKQFHWATILFPVSSMARGRFTLRATHIIISSQFNGCNAGTYTAEITHGADITTPDFRLEDEVDYDGAAYDRA